MTLKEEIYQAVHDHVEQRIKEFDDADYKATYSPDSRNGRINELLQIQNIIYKMFADYNEKLVKESNAN